MGKKSAAHVRALARVERANALIDLIAELAELFEVRQQPPTDLLLIRVRQVRHFCNCQFKALDHGYHISGESGRAQQLAADRFSVVDRLECKIALDCELPADAVHLLARGSQKSRRRSGGPRTMKLGNLSTP